MNDDLTTRLTSQLHDQVDDWHTAPLSLDSVRGKARSIRRTRRAVTGGAVVAAVLSIAVPLGLMQTTPDSGRPPVTNTPTEAPTEAVEPTPRPDGTFPLTLDVAEGEVPTSGYLVPDEQLYVTPQGDQQLPGRFLQLLPYGGGWVGLRAPAGDGGLEVVVLDADLQELSSAPTDGGLVAASGGSRIAWVEKTGNEGDWTVVNAPVDGGEPIRVATSANTRAVGFLADDTVATEYTLLDTGEVFFGEAGPDGEFDSRVLNGSDELTKYQVVRGTSLASGLAAGQTDFTGDGSCSEVRDVADEQVVLETCDHQLGAFSPDGRWVIGYAPYYDFGSPSLAILDATTGDVVVEFVSDRSQGRSATIQAAAWDDADTLVALVESQGEQAVLRFESNGAASRVSEVRDTRNMSLEFFLPGKPFGQN